MNDIILNVHNIDESLYFLKKEKERRQKVFWTTRERLIPIEEMTDQHLENVIQLLEKLQYQYDMITTTEEDIY